MNNDMISVVQNFICTKEKRLNILQEEVPNMAKVFKDCDFYIKKEYLKKVKNLYGIKILLKIMFSKVS